MSTRNEDRLGVQEPNVSSDAAVAAAAPAPVGLDLNFAMPTEFVSLPSKGKFYTPSHPLHGKETIEIKHMTTKEEDILNSQSLIKEGKVFDRLIQSVLVQNEIDVDSLLVADKNAIIIALRSINYGNLYSAEVTCKKCGETNINDFDLDEFNKDIEVDDSEFELEVEETNRGTYLIKDLPVTKWTFEVKPIAGREEKKFLKSVERRKKAKLNEDLLSSQILTFTVSVQGVDDRGTIAQAVSVLPAKDSVLLRRTYRKVFPFSEMKFDYTCPSCSNSERVDLPFTADFFWSN